MLTLKQIYDNKAAIIAGLEKKHFANAAETIEKECNPRSAVAALRSCYAFILLEPDK